MQGMTDRDDFLTWVKSTLYEAEVALHNGDAAPRRAIWSRNEPVSILGALRNAYGQHEVDEAFTFLERSFSGCTSFTFELQAYDVVGDMAYTAWPGADRGLHRRSAGQFHLASNPGVSPSACRHRDRVTVPDHIH
jgi:hypothetical protein